MVFASSPYEVQFNINGYLLRDIHLLKIGKNPCTFKISACQDEALFKFVFDGHLAESSYCEFHANHYACKDSVILKISDLVSSEFQSYIESLQIIKE
jgi:hypothetical protein